MPRKRRFFLPGVPVHVVQRGNNRQPVFLDDSDHRVYLEWLAYAAGEHGCSIHAYVVMTNHVHVLMTPCDGNALSAALQEIGRRFVPYVNHRYGRSGTLWEGRFRASLVQEERYLLACYRYIELNPVRAQMVDKPDAYPWSSYRANALGERDPLVSLSPHSLYLALGANPQDRQAAYRDLFATQVDAELLRNVRSCLQTGTPLGNDRFRAQVGQALGLRVGYSARGRPRKPVTKGLADADQIDLDLDKGI